MKLEVRQAVPSDIFYIVKNLSDANRKEIAKRDMTSRDLRNYVLEQTNAAPFDVAYLDGKPAAMFGVEITEEKTLGKNLAWTWFICTEDFFKAGARGVVFCRTYMKWFLKNNPEIQVLTISSAEEEHVQRWFEKVGGVLVREDQNVKIYAYS